MCEFYRNNLLIIFSHRRVPNAPRIIMTPDCCKCPVQDTRALSHKLPTLLKFHNKTMCKGLDDSSSTAPSMETTLTSSVREDESAASASAPVTSDASTTATKKTVSFQSVEISQYPMELGDNPSADGLPITLGWQCDSKCSFQLDEYETAKPEPRRRDQFWMPAQYREELLSRSGVTASQMLRTTNDMKRIQKSRHRSIRNQKWDKVHLFMEESGRKLKKISSVTNLKRISSTSSFLSSDSDTADSSATSLSKLMGLSKSMSSKNLIKGRGRYRSSDPLDDSHKAKLALHLLQHPEDLVVDEEECTPTEELSGFNMKNRLNVQLVEHDSIDF